MNAGNDAADQFHEAERKRLKLSWAAYWQKLAAQRVGTEKEQVADVLAQLRCGGYENRIRADTIEQLIKKSRVK